MPKGTHSQQDAAKLRHLAKKPHARGHCELCVTDAPVVARFTTDQPRHAVTVAYPEPAAS